MLSVYETGHGVSHFYSQVLEVEVAGSEVQGHLWLLIELEASLHYPT